MFVKSYKLINFVVTPRQMADSEVGRIGRPSLDWTKYRVFSIKSSKLFLVSLYSVIFLKIAVHYSDYSTVRTKRFYLCHVLNACFTVCRWFGTYMIDKMYFICRL